MEVLKPISTPMSTNAPATPALVFKSERFCPSDFLVVVRLICPIEPSSPSRPCLISLEGVRRELEGLKGDSNNIARYLMPPQSVRNACLHRRSHPSRFSRQPCSLSRFCISQAQTVRLALGPSCLSIRTSRSSKAKGFLI